MDVTSDLRRCLCRDIVNTVMVRDTPTKAWLAETLLLRPFEVTSTDDLAEMLRQLLGDEHVAKLLERESAAMYEPAGGRFLCGVCEDVAMVADADGKWTRCMRCNPGTRTEPGIVPPVGGEF